MAKYEDLTERTKARIALDRKAGAVSPYRFDDANATRRDPSHDVPTLIRPPFIRDVDKILHCPYFNRYTDKTQVFSFYRNDDISRRALHVQLVSRIARTIGRALGLNEDLIEAIALGHDIGHTPLGHAGEAILDGLYRARTGRRFRHNIHSVRVLDGIFPYNVTLETLSGIASHDGELELDEYRPAPLRDFAEFDDLIERCYTDGDFVKKLIPSTLEGCVVRISDIIAYLGKDRQDAERAHIIAEDGFEGGAIGTINAELINNLIVNVVENSYGKPYVRLDRSHFDALKKAKADNYRLIYENEGARLKIEETVKPMMTELYGRLLDDLIRGDKTSPIFTHHIAYVNKAHYARKTPYEQTEPNQLVVDYIASMTDDYFVDLHARLFPDSRYEIGYVGYFD